MTNQSPYISSMKQQEMLNIVDNCKHIVRQDRLWLRHIIKEKHPHYQNPNTSNSDYQLEDSHSSLIRIFQCVRRPLNKLHLYDKDIKTLQIKLRKFVSQTKKILKEQQINKMKQNSPMLLDKSKEKNRDYNQGSGYYDPIQVQSRSRSKSSRGRSVKSRENFKEGNSKFIDNHWLKLDNGLDQQFAGVTFGSPHNKIYPISKTTHILKKSQDYKKDKPSARSTWILKLSQKPPSIQAFPIKQEQECSRIRQQNTSAVWNGYAQNPKYSRLDKNSIERSNYNKNSHRQIANGDKSSDQDPHFRQRDSNRHRVVYAKNCSTRTQVLYDYQKDCRGGSAEDSLFVALSDNKCRQFRLETETQNDNRVLEHRKSKSRDDGSFIKKSYKQNNQIHQSRRMEDNIHQSIQQTLKMVQYRRLEARPVGLKFPVSSKIVLSGHTDNTQDLINSRTGSVVSESYQQSILKIKTMLEGSRRFINDYQRQKSTQINYPSNANNTFSLQQSKYSQGRNQFLDPYTEKDSGNTMPLHSFRPRVNSNNESYRSSNSQLKNIDMTSSVVRKHSHKEEPQSSVKSYASRLQENVFTPKNDDHNLFTPPQLLQQCRSFIKGNERSSSKKYLHINDLQYPVIYETNTQNESSQHISCAQERTSLDILKQAKETKTTVNKDCFWLKKDSQSQSQFQTANHLANNRLNQSPVSAFKAQMGWKSQEGLKVTTVQQALLFFFRGARGTILKRQQFEPLKGYLPLIFQISLEPILAKKSQYVSFFEIAMAFQNLPRYRSLAKDLLAILDLDVSHKSIVTPGNVRIFLENLSIADVSNYEQVEACLWRVFSKAVENDPKGIYIPSKSTQLGLSAISYWHLYYLQMRQDPDFSQLCRILGDFQFEIQVENQHLY